MRIDLHELLITPGKTLSFCRELDTSRLDHPAVSAYSAAPVGTGLIRNEAGLITLRGEIEAQMLCICDRCAKEFPLLKHTQLDVTLAAELEDEENPDYFLLEEDKLDIDELLESCFILDMDSRYLCKEDCKGLCSRCGADLNEGSCSCTKEKDPRLAVLEQLLDDKE